MIINSRTVSVLACLASVSLSGLTLPASAQIAVGGGGGAGPSVPDHDPVTGYVCNGPGCGTVRMNEASCICTKQNPYESNVKKLRLICETKKQGEWVACPVKPRYGIMIN